MRISFRLRGQNWAVSDFSQTPADERAESGNPQDVFTGFR
jgi:hypothetical protein